MSMPGRHASTDENPPTHVWMLCSLALADERAVDYFDHGSQDYRTQQGWHEVQAVYYGAEAGVPHVGGEATEEGADGNIDPVVIVRPAVVAKDGVLCRGGKGGGDR